MFVLTVWFPFPDGPKNVIKVSSSSPDVSRRAFVLQASSDYDKRMWLEAFQSVLKDHQHAVITTSSSSCSLASLMETPSWVTSPLTQVLYSKPWTFGCYKQHLPCHVTYTPHIHHNHFKIYLSLSLSLSLFYCFPFLYFASTHIRLICFYEKSLINCQHTLFKNFMIVYRQCLWVALWELAAILGCTEVYEIKRLTTRAPVCTTSLLTRELAHFRSREGSQPLLTIRDCEEHVIFQKLRWWIRS